MAPVNGCPSSSASANGKLSGGADVFSPRSGPHDTGSSSKPSGSKTPISLLNHNTMPDQPTIVSSEPQPIGSSRVATRASPKKPFTTDVGEFNGSHVLKVINLTGKDLHDNGIVNHLVLECEWKDKMRDFKILKDVDRVSTVLFCLFDDFRATAVAHQEASFANSNWTVMYSNHEQYVNAKREAGFTDTKTSCFDGQVLLVVGFDGTSTEFDGKNLEKVVHSTANAFGEVWTIEDRSLWPNIVFRVEYFKISDAENALKNASAENPFKVDKYSIVAKEMKVEHGSGNCISNTIQAEEKNGKTEYTSPTGRTKWYKDENGVSLPLPVTEVSKIRPVQHSGPMAAEAGYRNRYHSAPVIHGATTTDSYDSSRSASWAGPTAVGQAYTNYHQQHSSHGVTSINAVQVGKIAIGQEMRTTVMLRNIPNQMQVEEIKAMLDHVVFGKYDFLYLRIDFAKATNVGYAFVNFVKPTDVIPFVDRYAGKRWQPTNRRQVELSFATVQGYDCLIAKFRNSAIMDEFVGYRPKLFFTYQTAPTPDKVGIEAPFPGPDNLSKKQRSRDNASSIGLFAPRSGRCGRDRGRRSHYDRGTPSQMYDDAYYNGYMSPYNGGFGYSGIQDIGTRMAGPPPAFTVPVYNHGASGNPFFVHPGYGHAMFEADPFFYGGYNNGQYTAPSGYHAQGYSNVSHHGNTAHPANGVRSGPVQRPTGTTMKDIIEATAGFDLNAAAGIVEGYDADAEYLDPPPSDH